MYAMNERLAEREREGRPIRAALIGLGQRGTDIVARVDRMKGFELSVVVDIAEDNIRNVILRERRRGATVFLTTHDMMEADKLSDRVAFIDSGQIVALDTPHNLKQKYGKRSITAQVITPIGSIENREIAMDSENTARDVETLFERQKVVTIHSKEASHDI